MVDLSTEHNLPDVATPSINAPVKETRSPERLKAAQRRISDILTNNWEGLKSLVDSPAENILTKVREIRERKHQPNAPDVISIRSQLFGERSILDTMKLPPVLRERFALFKNRLMQMNLPQKIQAPILLLSGPRIPLAA